MDPEEIRRQIDLMAEAGWGGIFIQSRVGLIPPYMSDEWFAAVDAAVDQCRKRELKVWLYDEDKWPSGYGGGAVPLADRSFRQQALIARPTWFGRPPDCEPLGEAREGLQLYVWTAPLGHDWFNGACYGGLLHREAMRKFVDQAYKFYHARYREDYGDLIVGKFTDEPCSIFRIRLPHGAVPFTPALPGRFQERWGYDPAPHLHLLYSHTNGAARFRLHYFRTVNELFEENFTRQLGDWCEAHGIGLTGHFMHEDSLYCQQTWGVKIMPNYRHMRYPGVGHPERHVGNLITLKQCQSVVNQYGKTRMLSEIYGGAGGSLTFEDRHWIASQQVCFGVNLINPQLSLYTMAGCRKRDYPQNIFYQQPWWSLNAELDLPLGRLCAALSQGKYVPEFLLLHPGESAFVHWETELDPEKFNGLLDWNQNRQPTTQAAMDRINAIDAAVKELIEILLAGQRVFDMGDETILAESGEVVDTEDGPRLRIQKMDYQLVMIPMMATIAETTIELLEKFAAAGGEVLYCNEFPSTIDGERNEKRLRQAFRRFRMVTHATVLRRLRQLIHPIVEAVDIDPKHAKKLFAHVRDLGAAERLVFLTNLSRSIDFTAVIRLNGGYRSARWLDTATGEERLLDTREAKRNETRREKGEECQAIEVELPFDRTESHLLLLRRQPAETGGVSLARAAPVESIRLEKWSVKRLDDNAITLDYARWRIRGGEFSSAPDPVIGLQQYLNSRKYDGPLTLRYLVEVDSLAPDRRICLVVERPELYRIAVNGREVGPSGLPPWRDFRWSRIDITGMLRRDQNIIELHCDNFRHGDVASTHDTERRYGAEIEAIYLVGDFAARGKPLPVKPVAEHWRRFELPPIHVQCFQRGSFQITDPIPLAWGDTTLQGLPFYAGRLSYETKLPNHHRRQGKWFLKLSELDCPIAEVFADDRRLGVIYKHPLEIEIPTEASRIKLALYGTLRNLLGPHHHTSGELASVGPHNFAPEPAHNENGDNVWIFKRSDGEGHMEWMDDYCMVSFGRMDEARLIRR